MGGNCLIVGGFDCWEVFWLMYLCHVSWMLFYVIFVGLGSLMCFWDAGSISVAARVDRAESSLGWGRGLSPLCGFACTAVTF